MCDSIMVPFISYHYYCMCASQHLCIPWFGSEAYYIHFLILPLQKMKKKKLNVSNHYIASLAAAAAGGRSG